MHAHENIFYLHSTYFLLRVGLSFPVGAFTGLLERIC
jgi:hypothetical protein